MGSPDRVDLEYLYKYAMECQFIIETGGGGHSTVFLSQAAKINNARFVSIELDKNKVEVKIPNVEYRYGWSITRDDIIRPGDPQFRKSRYKNQPDEFIAFNDNDTARMVGEIDLIRKVVKESNIPIDFFFCDTGEYCGIAEWNIVQPLIKIGGYIALHDIHYPKSIKCFQVYHEILSRPSEWQLMVKTDSRQGLCIARKTY